MSDYKHPETLVSTQWAAEHLNDPKIRLVEVDVDTSAYDQGHIPGAVGWNWQSQLQDNIRRDLIGQEALETLLGQSGISNDTTILLYGDNNNWFAAYAFWQLKYYGHKDVRLINGGRKKGVERKASSDRGGDESGDHEVWSDRSGRVDSRAQGRCVRRTREEESCPAG